eukprot:993269-Amphidinium_carterae.1
MSQSKRCGSGLAKLKNRRKSLLRVGLLQHWTQELLSILLASSLAEHLSYWTCKVLDLPSTCEAELEVRVPLSITSSMSLILLCTCGFVRA